MLNHKNNKNMDSNEKKFVNEKVNEIIEMAQLMKSLNSKNLQKNLVKNMMITMENLQYYINIIQ